MYPDHHLVTQEYALVHLYVSDRQFNPRGYFRGAPEFLLDKRKGLKELADFITGAPSYTLAGQDDDDDEDM